ncbi:hypothetical protein [Kitasatospora brasiliensis]|uniref:hypothetical protein n=1 Tax=Kitasatospora brasiliensis TaxID=3058040 RepID=UPI002930EAD1|nr:hypothetical protein [Kitasatospora sp. K002]
MGRRFNGPPSSANGGYACGLLATRAAARLGANTVAVTLHAPPPLDRECEIRAAGRRIHLWDGADLLASVSPTDHPIEALPAVTVARARAAEARFEGLAHHPFPGCFVCGYDRPARDGLRIFPGPLDDRGSVACTWLPDASIAGPDGLVPAEIVWAALDCPGGWTAPHTTPRVLGWMTARIDSLPVVGRRYVTTAVLRSRERGTLTNTSALFDQDGRELARAITRWMAVDPDRLGASTVGSGDRPGS